jgi:hypothetical protein
VQRGQGVPQQIWVAPWLLAVKQPLLLWQQGQARPASLSTLLPHAGVRHVLLLPTRSCCWATQPAGCTSASAPT